jgi:nucleotide-binding universal stress UspA family protein
MDLTPESENRGKLAADLADRLSARLIGVAAHPIRTPMYFETPVTGLLSMVEIEERQANEHLARAETIFRKIANGGNEAEWRSAVGFPLEHTLRQARAADLIVVTRASSAADVRDPMSVGAGDLVMAAGRPVLIVPPAGDFISAKRIVLGWKDTREARRAVWDALPLFKLAEEVVVVSVDADDETVKDIAAYLARHGVSASARNPAATKESTADALIRMAEVELADLIVCGAYGHSRAQEWVFGGVTRDLLDHAPVCCLMAH